MNPYTITQKFLPRDIDIIPSFESNRCYKIPRLIPFTGVLNRWGRNLCGFRWLLVLISEMVQHGPQLLLITITITISNRKYPNWVSFNDREWPWKVGQGPIIIQIDLLSQHWSTHHLTNSNQIWHGTSSPLIEEACFFTADHAAASAPRNFRDPLHVPTWNDKATKFYIVTKLGDG